jgi:acrylyl-CoA reductase (NADPH)
MKALVLEKSNKDVFASVQEMSEDNLPDGGDVLVDVAFSSLNYKDALAVTGRGDIIRGDYPFVPGIDLAGTVVETTESASGEYAPGDRVIVTGWGIGEETWGGFSQRQRVRADWCVPLPEALSMKDAMGFGTAGLTAMLALMALESYGVASDRGEVVVTGASGGVGSFGVALLDGAGYDAVASTGSEDAHGYLRNLGAARIIGRGELGDGPERPLDRGRWAGAMDAVGGDTLAALLSQTKRHGAVASYGLAGGPDLTTTVFPFILRGVGLLGIDSNTCPQERRLRAWQRLARNAPASLLERIVSETTSLKEVPAASERVLRGETTGRIVVDVNA